MDNLNTYHVIGAAILISLSGLAFCCIFSSVLNFVIDFLPKFSFTIIKKWYKKLVAMGRFHRGGYSHSAQLIRQIKYEHKKEHFNYVR